MPIAQFEQAHFEQSGAGFGSGPGGGAPFPVFATAPGTAVVTLTGYKRGKISGTLSATLVGILDASSTIDGNATFTSKCTVQ